MALDIQNLVNYGNTLKSMTFFSTFTWFEWFIWQYSFFGKVEPTWYKNLENFQVDLVVRSWPRIKQRSWFRDPPFAKLGKFNRLFQVRKCRLTGVLSVIIINNSNNTIPRASGTRNYQQYANKNSSPAFVMHMMDASTRWYMCLYYHN